MANWVHCNKCFDQPQKNRIGFFLTECGHVACERCTEQIKSSSTCIVCCKPTRVIKLSKDMDPSVRCFFNPLDSQLRKFIEIYNFQSNHKELFLNNYVKKYEYAKQQCMKQYAINNKLMQEKKKLQSLVRHSYDLDGPISSTPISKHSFQNASLSTITPERNKFGNMYGKDQPTLFTPMKTVPGFAQRLYGPKLIDQTTSTVSQGISPAQVVPITGNAKTSVPIHRFPLGPMSSLQELQRGKRFN